MSACRFFRVKCACGDFTCRILGHSEKKLSKAQMVVCHGDDYMTECLRYEVGVEHYKMETEKVGCLFLKPHDCVGCQKDWRCEGSVVPFVIEENIEACLSDEYEGCPNYKTGMAQRELAKNIKLAAKKRDKRIEIAMRNVEGILSTEENDAERLVKLKTLYRARLVDLHEYKSELRRVKGKSNGAE